MPHIVRTVSLTHSRTHPALLYRTPPRSPKAYFAAFDGLLENKRHARTRRNVSVVTRILQDTWPILWSQMLFHFIVLIQQLHRFWLISTYVLIWQSAQRQRLDSFSLCFDSTKTKEGVRVKERAVLFVAPVGPTVPWL